MIVTCTANVKAPYREKSDVKSGLQNVGMGARLADVSHSGQHTGFWPGWWSPLLAIGGTGPVYGVPHEVDTVSSSDERRPIIGDTTP